MGNRLRDIDLSENSLKVQEKVMNSTIERLSESEKGKEILDAMNESAKINEAIESDDPELQEQVAEQSYMKLVKNQDNASDLQDQIMKKHVGDKYDKLKD